MQACIRSCMEKERWGWERVGLYLQGMKEKG